MFGIPLKILGIFELLLIIFGIFGNLFVFGISLRLQKSNSTFLILAFLAICDLICPFGWDLGHFMDPIFNIDSGNSGDAYCKIYTFLQFSSLQLSAWFLVFMSVDRYFSVLIITWKTVYLTHKRVLLICIFLTVAIISLNITVFFIFGQHINENGTDTFLCYATPDNPSSQIMNTWNLVHSVLYSYIPFCVLAISNFLLILHLQIKKRNFTSRSSRNSSSNNRQSSMNVTVITITLLFFITTLPGTVITIYSDTLLTTEWGLFVMSCSDTFSNMYHTLNFITLMISNKRFSKEVKTFFNAINLQNRLFSLCHKRENSNNFNSDQNNSNSNATSALRVTK